MEKDYKDTLNLPKTTFPMKANLPNREPEFLKFWDDQKIYEQMLEQNKDGDTFILHDGPPYANGHIHIGHALNKILKDIIIKFQSMNGKRAPYVPGWDCHGLPIELEVDKKLGKKKRETDTPTKRKLCREYAAKFVDIQREEFKRLGVLGKWDEPYLTMTNDYEAAIAGELMEFVKNGYAYKGKKPVHWCPSCVTALAEAEVEHADKESPSVFVKFKLHDDAAQKLGLNDAHMVIWTTTPWTLPANLALAVNPKIEYSAIKNSDGAVLIVATELVKRLTERGAITPEGDAIKIMTGSELVGLEAAHPFIERNSRVIEAGFVTVEEGTGVVHIAPGHGEDDYIAGLREGLEIYAPVNQYGKFQDAGVEEIENQFVFKANEPIIEILKSKNALLGQEVHSHSYPHCWRCKKPVIFRATEQWFISMKHNDLKDRCIAEIDKVRWIPSWGRERIHGMLSSRPDWCISRQRTWGVPITVISCTKCGKAAIEDEVTSRIKALISERSADVWFELEAKEILPEGYKCECGSDEFEKEMDILDVWFDSGVSHAATLTKERGLTWPADMYLEGSDQHRGWFQSSMLASVGNRGSAPYRQVLTHGFVVDGKGKKMSKSVGNVVAPQDIIKNTGAEIVRLWVSAEDYSGDVRISKEIVARLTEAYRKIRNTSKYLLGNLHDFPGGDYSDKLTEIDRWAMSRLQGLTDKVTKAYENYSFHEVYHTLYNFCIVDMSSFYLDILKDRLYTFRSDSDERRAAQWVLNETLSTMTRLMAPVLSFTSEEIWRFMPVKPEQQSIFLSSFPKVNEKFIDNELEQKWAKLIAVRDEVNKALELKRRDKFIGNALEASVTVHASGELNELLTGYTEMLPALFIVSQASLDSDGQGEHKSEEIEGLSVSVARAEGEKCTRCWNYSTTVGTMTDAPGICTRCSTNVD